VYVSDPSETQRPTIKTSKPGPNGEQYCWWQCTVKGGREGRDIDAVELARAVQVGGGEGGRGFKGGGAAGRAGWHARCLA
jgi:glutamine amidotransferase/cyclase